MHHLLSNILVYFDRNICWTTVIGGNQSSFRARNKSRTAIYQFTISHQFSRCGMRLIVMCNQLKKTLVRLYIDIRLAHKQHANHFLSAHSIWYIFFHVWQFVLLLLEWGWLLCVQPAEKSLSFICDMCIVHRTTIRSVHSGMQRTTTSVPTQYYIYVSAALLSFDQASWWVVRWSSCVGHKIFLCIWCGVLPLRKYHGTIFNSQQGPIHDI